MAKRQENNAGKSGNVNIIVIKTGATKNRRRKSFLRRAFRDSICFNAHGLLKAYLKTVLSSWKDLFCIRYNLRGNNMLSLLQKRFLLNDNGGFRIGYKYSVSDSFVRFRHGRKAVPDASLD